MPASYPGVVSVGGTTLTLNEEGRREQETVWNGNGPLNAGGFEAGVSGGGCSMFFEAPFWQRYANGFAATGCGDKRLSADVSAVADPQHGFSVDDTYDCGPECEEFTGGREWSVIGGTSLSTPLIAGLYALAGGAGGVPYPAMTLYAPPRRRLAVRRHAGRQRLLRPRRARVRRQRAATAKRLDCEGTTACNASAGYDGPSGVGAPASLEAFEPVPGEEAAARRRAEEAIEAEARRHAEEEAARQPKPPARQQRAGRHGGLQSRTGGGPGGDAARDASAGRARGLRHRQGRLPGG